MTVGQIFTKIGIFIENRQIFMLLNWNCAKLANFEIFLACSGGPFFRGHSVYAKQQQHSTRWRAAVYIIGGRWLTDHVTVAVGSRLLVSTTFDSRPAQLSTSPLQQTIATKTTTMTAHVTVKAYITVHFNYWDTVIPSLPSPDSLFPNLAPFPSP